MSVLDAIRRWLGAEEGMVYECRNCGQTLDADQRDCPACGSGEIVEYDLR